LPVIVRTATRNLPAGGGGAIALKCIVGQAFKQERTTIRRTIGIAFGKVIFFILSPYREMTSFLE
jgi:hypothetical protein